MNRKYSYPIRWRKLEIYNNLTCTAFCTEGPLAMVSLICLHKQTVSNVQCLTEYIENIWWQQFISVFCTEGPLAMISLICLRKRTVSNVQCLSEYIENIWWQQFISCLRGNKVRKCKFEQSICTISCNSSNWCPFWQKVNWIKCEI
jgi:hypothetical protein